MDAKSWLRNETKTTVVRFDASQRKMQDQAFCGFPAPAARSDIPGDHIGRAQSGAVYAYRAVRR